MFKITSCSASCFSRKVLLLSTISQDKWTNEWIYGLPPSQWKHTRTEFFPSSSQEPHLCHRVKISNIPSLDTTLQYQSRSWLINWFQGLLSGRSSAFSYEPIFSCGGWGAGQALQAEIHSTLLYSRDQLSIKTCSKVLGASYHLSLIQTPKKSL